jgi:hypothetical protein
MSCTVVKEYLKEGQTVKGRKLLVELSWSFDKKKGENCLTSLDLVGEGRVSEDNFWELHGFNNFLSDNIVYGWDVPAAYDPEADEELFIRHVKYWHEDPWKELRRIYKEFPDWMIAFHHTYDCDEARIASGREPYNFERRG